MTIPISTYYPVALDTDENLFLAHDALRMTLIVDYNPGDKVIHLDGDPNVLANFPPSGLITLTEQCSDIDKRAISFFYTTIDRTAFTIGGLEILPCFQDVIKPKRITHVTQNVMAQHHNHIKDALIAIENFIGVQGTIDLKPLGPTMEGRINFLRKLVLSPRAYFSADRRIGLVPLTVEFTDLSFRLGTDGTTGVIEYVWDFGDNTVSNVSTTISETSVVPINTTNVLIDDLDGGTITKTYSTPGIYSVKLTVSNKYGSDTIIWPDMIQARVEAPEEAVVEFTPVGSQILTSGSPSGGPYTVPPTLRTAVNSLVNLSVLPGQNPSNPGYSYAGEKLNGSLQAIDPIVSFTWSLGDDLPHNSLSSATRGSYGIGGLYDMKLRVDTINNAYRITTYQQAIDVVESTNLWMFNLTTPTSATAYEYGLISGTFKTAGTSSYTVDRDASFLSGETNHVQLTREFKRNTGFTSLGTASSGNNGDSILFYAGGRQVSDSPTTEMVNAIGFNGFTNTYPSATSFARPWNWAFWSSLTKGYFMFGATNTPAPPFTSPTNPVLTTYDLGAEMTTDVTFDVSNYLNGSVELMNNVATFSGTGDSNYGDFSVLRAAWKGTTGYLLRNDGIGQFFRIKNFYMTQGTVGTQVQNFTKLLDMPGPTKLEGDLLTMTGGLYFFNNSGAISAYNDVTGIWETSGPGVNSATFRSFQDSNVGGFDDASNTLLAASDGDKKAYLSYDYSRNAFTQFNSGDLTFRALGQRPAGEQWIMGIY
jgi:PKD repeat protein